MVRWDYLVLLCHTMDDIPMRLFGDRADAVEFAKQLDGDVPDKIRELIVCDPSTPSCVKVVDFKNGVPVASEVVKDFFFGSEDQ